MKRFVWSRFASRTVQTAIMGVFAVCLCLPTQEAFAIPTSGLVGYWQAEGNANDSAGSNHGTLQNGTTFAPGKIGQAFSFDGANDYVRVPGSASLPSGSSARTLAMWVYTRPSSWVDNQNTVFHSGGTATRQAFSLDMRPHPNMEFYTWNDDTVFDAGVPLEGWMHVALVYDGNVGIQAYTQGVLRGSKTLGGVLNTPVVDVQIGALIQLSSYFDGLIDEVAIYNRVLSQTEIQSIVNEANAVPEPSTLLLLGTGLVRLVGYGRRKRRT